MSFDEYAKGYEAALEMGISVSGETKDYFARGRIQWLQKCLRERNEASQSIMDYGCGIGSATPLFLELMPRAKVLGVDVSLESLATARSKYGSPRAQYVPFGEYQPAAEMDLAFCNGVFHHIAPPDRMAAIDYIYRSLRPGGYFGFWENNPWNPGTRYVMSRIPFDRDAIPLTASEARRLLRAGGFKIIRTDWLFLFPRMLRSLRFLEPLLAPLPFGAQYQVLCQRP